MTSRRSTSKEREKKQKARKKWSKEQIDKDREASRRRMKLLRESRKEMHASDEKIEDTDWYAKIMDRARVTMKQKRANQSQDEKEDEKIDLRLRVRNLRANKPEEEKEYGKLFQKHKKRESRAKRSGKQHLIENMKAKKGMNLLKEKGRIRDFERRAIKNSTEMSDWKTFMKKGKSYSDLISKRKPDIVARLNQEI